MAIFTGWINRVLTAFNGKSDVQPVAILLKNADDSPDVLGSDGAGGAKIAIPRTHTAITPSDTADVSAIASQGVYIFAAGNLTYKTAGGLQIGPVSVAAGTYIPGQFSVIYATGTTASSIIGLS